LAIGKENQLATGNLQLAKKINKQQAICNWQRKSISNRQLAIGKENQ
jgi:hypothetical protein